MELADDLIGLDPKSQIVVQSIISKIKLDIATEEMVRLRSMIDKITEVKLLDG